MDLTTRQGQQAGSELGLPWLASGKRTRVGPAPGSHLNLRLAPLEVFFHAPDTQAVSRQPAVHSAAVPDWWLSVSSAHPFSGAGLSSNRWARGRTYLWCAAPARDPPCSTHDTRWAC